MRFDSRRASRLVAYVCGGVSAFITITVFATNTQLITHEDAVALPGVGRIVAGFLITVALAAVVVFSLRKWLPQFVNRPSATHFNISMQTVTQNGMRLHIVAIDGRTVLIAEGKGGIAITTLTPAAGSSSSMQA